jgi:hypothetical protein
VYLKQKFKFANKIPSATPHLPIIGNTHLLIGKDDHQRLELLTRLCQDHDKMFKFMIGPQPIFVAPDPDTIHTILTNNNVMDRPFFYKFMRMDNGILAGSCKSYILIISD